MVYDTAIGTCLSSCLTKQHFQEIFSMSFQLGGLEKKEEEIQVILHMK